MKKLLTLAFILIATAQFAFSQQAIAKIKYEEAEEAYAAKNYQLTISKLNEVETLLKSTNPRVMYLKILAQYEYAITVVLSNYHLLEDTKQLCKKYLKEYESIPDNEDKYREVYKKFEILNTYPEDKNAFIKNIDSFPDAAKIYYRSKDSIADLESSNDTINNLLLFKRYTELANNGDTTVFVELGDIYRKGISTKVDYPKALYYYQIAAQKGNVRAYLGLGIIYQYGCSSIKKDNDLALEYFEKAGSDGLLKIGLLYYMKNNYNKAFKYFSLSAEQNSSEGHFWLGSVYQSGTGAKQDINLAINHFKISSEQKNWWASQSLGNLYYYGIGMPKNWSLAQKYFRLAVTDIKAKRNDLGIYYNSMLKGLKQILYDIYNTGGWGVEKNEIEAYRWK